MDVRLAAATELDFPALHRVVGRAFSDYIVPFHLTEEQLRHVVEWRGFDPSISLVAMDGAEPVGFWLVGRDPVRPETAYIVSTGVVPEARRRGLARRIYTGLEPKLREAGLREVLLEVIEGNDPAATLYMDLGFRTVRRFACWRGALPGDSTAGERQPGEIREAAVEEALDLAAGMASWAPSWQNGATAVRRAGRHAGALAMRVDGETAGVLIGAPATGYVFQHAVRPNLRRRGVGGALLRAWSRRTEQPLTVLNVDAADPGSTAFYERHLGTQLLFAHEMVHRPEG